MYCDVIRAIYRRISSSVFVRDSETIADVVHHVLPKTILRTPATHLQVADRATHHLGRRGERRARPYNMRWSRATAVSWETAPGQGAWGEASMKLKAFNCWTLNIRVAKFVPFFGILQRSAAEINPQKSDVTTRYIFEFQ